MLKRKFSFDVALLISSLLVISLITNKANATLNDDLDKVFNSMSNKTNPHAYETERRGVISGGSLEIRNEIKSANILSMTSPKVQADCGGIDLYGGSFSYINKDEFIAFLRSVAANAQGYAFEIALSSMCEKCMQTIETLQRKVQELNQYFGNSCQLAQGIVNDSLSAFNRKGLNDISLIGQFEGVGDLFELSTSQNPQTLTQKVSEKAPEKVAKLSGNIVWQAMLESNLFSQNLELSEELLSVTGTIILNNDAGELTIAPSGLITLESLIFGGDFLLYKCNSLNDGGCTQISEQTKTLKGIKVRLLNLFIGENNEGIIYKFSKNQGTLTTKETQILNALPQGIVAKIRTLASKNEGAAKSFILFTSSFIALELTKVMLDTYILNIETLVSSSEHPYQAMMLNKIGQLKNDINNQKLLLSQKFGNEKDINEYYETLLNNISQNQYLINE